MKDLILSLNWHGTTDTSSLTGLVKTAYSKAVEFSFQPKLYFAQFAQMKRWDIDSKDPMPGNAVSFTIFNNLTVATGALSETGDPTAEGMGKTQRTVTLYEYGKLVTTSRKLRTLSFANIDLAVGRVVGDNMGKSVDLIARAAFDAHTGSSYISYASGTNATAVLATSTLSAAKVRYAKNRLSRNDVMKPDGRYYIAIIHPDVAHDLRAETGAGAWRQPKEYAEPEDIYNGEIGVFEGFRFIETTNAKVASNGASGSVDLYSTYFFGYQAVGYAEGIPPQMGMSGPFDALQRLMHIYWYALIGFGELRRESLFKVFSASSVGDNT